MKIKNKITGLFFLIWGISSITQSQSVSTDAYKRFRKDPSFNREIDFNHIDYKKMNEVIFHLTNEIRVKNNLNPLDYVFELEEAAMMHAKDMVDGDFFDHINSKDVKKRTPNDRAKLCSITNPFLAENIIEGYGLQYKSHETIYLRGKGNFSKTPDGELIRPQTYLSFGEAQLNGWMNSKEHRKNILSKDALQLGVGAAIYYNSEFNDMPTFFVVQNFQWYKPVIVD